MDLKCVITYKQQSFYEEINHQLEVLFPNIFFRRTYISALQKGDMEAEWILLIWQRVC